MRFWVYNVCKSICLQPTPKKKSICQCSIKIVSVSPNLFFTAKIKFDDPIIDLYMPFFFLPKIAASVYHTDFFVDFVLMSNIQHIHLENANFVAKNVDHNQTAPKGAV